MIVVLNLILIGALIALGRYLAPRLAPTARRLATAATVRVRRWRAPDRPQPVPADKPFRILALGLAGSGKTVFLASMYNQLFLPRRPWSYHLKTSPAATLKLNGLHKIIVDPEAEWPDNTLVSQTAPYRFDVAVTADGQTHELIPVEYLDYSGELFSDVELATSKHFSTLNDYRRSANLIFWFIDGHKLVHYLRGEQAGITYFDNTINPMLAILHEVPCPVHLVITKWDVVRNIGEEDPNDPESRLQFVRQQLERHDNVRAVLDQIGHNRFVRLIPVSSVGDDFARPDGPNSMIKLPDAKPRPINVEMPLVLAIPDFMRQVESAVTSEDLERLRQAARSDLVQEKPWRQPVNDLLSGVLGTAQLTAQTVVLANLVGTWLIRKIEQAELRRAARRKQGAAAELEKLERRISVLNQLEKATWAFDYTFPSGILRGSYQDQFDGPFNR